mmetsp:Transcript_28119/g.77414  ORF Transcript_28119/g.77414 Transcript_28119/m.77414 type:complete len:228 (-) Transcript_28119:263-946(-)
MFAGCCCSDPKDSGQLNFHAQVSDEQVPCGESKGFTRSDAASRTTGPPRVAGAHDGPQADQAATPDIPVVSARSLTPEEKEQEKARIQDMVNRFARSALVGCPCVCIREASGERIATKYRINKNLEYLVVLSARDEAKAEITCPIADIQDIYSYVEDGETCFPPVVLSALRPEELELLLMVVFHADGDKVYRFCLLEQCIDARDTFLECLRILCIYASSARNSRAAQ